MRSIYQLILFCSLALNLNLSLAQTITLDVEWENEFMIENGDTTVIQNCSYCALDDNYQPYIVYSISDAIDSVWIAASEGDFLLGYDTELYAPLAITKESIISGTKEITNIKIPAYYVENGNLKKIRSVSIAFSLRNETPLLSTRNKKSATFASESKLSNGTWYKLEVKKDGVYKLDANYLNSMGIDISSLDAKKIKIYGSGNAMLPQQNNLDRPDDLVENAIYVSSASTFSSNDYVLFYGQSPHKLVIDTLNKLISHTKNIYTESSYYFITVDGDDGLRVGSQNVTGTPTKTVTTFDEYVYEEKDAYNALSSGRSWYAENFDFQTDKQFTISTVDKVDNSIFRYQSAVMAQAYASSVDFITSLNNKVIGVQTVNKNTVSTKGYGVTGYDKITDFNLEYSTFGNASSFDVNVNFVGDANNNAAGNKQTHGFFDYLAIQYTRYLSTTQSQVIFRSFESVGQGQQLTSYELGVASSYSVWNVTNPINPLVVTLQNVGNKKQFVEDANELNQYVMFKEGEYLSVQSHSQVLNQNLHGINTVPNLIIVTYPDFKDAAQKLADYRASQGLSYLLVTPEEIYNEFSSGAQDVSAIRDFIKMLFDRDSNSLQYLILFGAASYDYKNVLDNNTNFIPTYESIESLHNVGTYASDDYYGFLTDGDGEWNETSSNTDNHELRIAVGRIPIISDSEKDVLVDKIVHYHDSKDVIGEWRTKLLFLADDGDNHLHEKDANNLADYCTSEYPTIKTKKLFLDSYEQFTGASVVSPDFEKEFNKMITQGALIVNYTGHGGVNRLAWEKILTVDDIFKQTNYDRLPLYVTATCEFGRYDKPGSISGAMALVNSSTGGAIATISTTRPVYASSNFKINQAFYQEIFQRKSDSTYLTLGEAFVKTKNNSFSGINNRNFSLLGDPCLSLSLPNNKVILDQFNQNPITAITDTLKALSEITLAGKITDGFENTLIDFNGVVYIEVFDKESEYTTLGSEGSTYTYNERSSYLFSGEASVVHGVFTVSFPVPKDISYGYELGKVSMYAYDNDSIVDAAGYYSNVLIGGTDPNAILNDEGPIADLFMDDESFVYGGNTASTTLFIAELSDENGINITNTSVGHEITLVVDGAIDNTIVLNEFYSANIDDYQNGLVEYELSNLSDGKHHLKFTAWDTHNNPVIEELEFVVGSDFTFYTYPNPFIDETTLFIDHSLGGQYVVVTVTIVDDQGREMLTEDYEYDEAPNVIDNIVWDGTFNGTEAASGLYFVKVYLNYPNLGTATSKIDKVVLLH